MELDGTWRAAVADEGLRRAWHVADFEPAGWEPIEVPGHWRSTPAFSGTDGPVLYQRSFEAPAPDPGRRSWLTFDGLFYQGDVWLDGSYLGDTEGYFAPHTFEITTALASRAQHSLAVEATCAAPADLTANRCITGVFQHRDCLDPAWNPGGIWRAVRIDETGPVRIARLRVTCLEANEQRAVLDLRAELDADVARTVSIRTTLGELDHRSSRPVAAGPNALAWALTIDRPRLWWPRALGASELYEVSVAVELAADEGGGTSDERRLRTGLREIRLQDWVASVNGERLFLKGTNQGPTRMALAEATPAELGRDVDLAVEAGLDLLRVHGHVTRPELYARADEVGLMVWQDFPLQRGYARGVRKQAAVQATQMVDLLGHHPSIALWCAHNEAMAIQGTGGFASRRERPGRAARSALAQQLPRWNRTVLDRSVKRTIRRADPSRPVVAHSGVSHLPQLDGTDLHLYFGWYRGDERDLAGFCRAVPRLARFVSELGAQAVPTAADFCEPDRWPDLDWERLGRDHSLQKERFDLYVPPAEHDSFDSWQDATQRYQARLIRRQVEHLRRLKYRPTGGFAQSCFADAHPGVTWSVLDHERNPKLGFEALQAACRPVIVVADRLGATVAAGDALALDVHVVSDLRTEISAAEVTARLTWDGGERSWRWRGDVPADSCARVGTVQVVVPDAAGTLRLALRCSYDDTEVTNEDEAPIVG